MAKNVQQLSFNMCQNAQSKVGSSKLACCMKAELRPIGRVTFTRTLLFWAALAIACVIMAVRLFGQGERVTTKEFMREKLNHSQNILKALTEEDYFTITKDAKRLSAMTQEAPWQAFQNPDYAQYSIAFRRHANTLAKAAGDKNIDAATLAYVRLTMSCIDCHKFVRGKLIGEISDTNRPRGG